MNSATRPAELFEGTRVWASKIDCVNWGTFSNLHSATLSPNGLMITGETGSGKSTIVDAYTTLLQGTSANYNVAATQDGQGKDRDAMTYVRGYTSSSATGENDCLRGDTVVSVIRTLFSYSDGRTLTAALILSVNGTSRSVADLKRIYMLYNSDVPIRDLYQAYTENPQRFKQNNKQNASLIVQTESYKAYRSFLMQALGIENENALQLLNRAMGVKQVKNLDQMLRTLVLEEGSFKQKAEVSLEESAALRAIKTQITDAQAQITELQPIADAELDITQSEQIILEADNDLAHAESFFAHLALPQLQQVNTREVKALNAVSESFNQAELMRDQLSDEVGRYQAEFMRLGGNRIEDLEKEIFFKTKLSDTTERESRNYAQIASSLSLDATISHEVFLDNQSRSKSAAQTLLDEKREVESSRGEASGALYNNRKAISDLSEEIEALSKRRSSIPERYQNLRDQIADDLSIDEESLVFVGELIQIQPEAIEWRGAVERALGMRKLTLLVSEDDEARVTQYVNRRHLNLNFRLQSIATFGRKDHAVFKADGYLRKLDWKDHPYRDAVKQLLAHADLSCVDESQLASTPHSMTVTGLIQYERGKFTKDDRKRIDDPREYATGFSNIDRIHALQHQQGDLEQVQPELLKAEKELIKRAKDIDDAIRAWEALEKFDWDTINFFPLQRELKELNDQLIELRKTAKDADRAQAKMNDAKTRLRDAEENIKALIKEQTLAQDRCNRTADIMVRVQECTDGYDSISEETQARLRAFLPDAETDLESAESVERHWARIKQTAVKDAGDRRVSAKTKIDTARAQAERAIKRYKANEDWEQYSTEWGSTFDYRKPYLEHHASLVEEGLPNLEERFLAKLNEQSTDNVSGLVTHYQNERKDIEDRILSINEVLERTDYTPKSYLRLDMKVLKSVVVEEFEAQVKNVIHRAATIRKDVAQDQEHLYKALESVNAVLEGALSNPDKKDNRELLDVRYQLSFTAVEVDRETGEELNHFGATGTKGKSGGEKESFTGIILAASLSYVLTPDGSDRVGFATVFLDEAFSNTSNIVARRVIAVFKKMGLILNIITPFKNMDIAKDAADTVLIAEKNAETDQSRLIQMSWEEAERQLSDRDDQTNRAEALGITVSES